PPLFTLFPYTTLFRSPVLETQTRRVGDGVCGALRDLGRLDSLARGIEFVVAPRDGENDLLVDGIEADVGSRQSFFGHGLHRASRSEEHTSELQSLTNL